MLVQFRFLSSVLALDTLRTNLHSKIVQSRAPSCLGPQAAVVTVSFSDTAVLSPAAWLCSCSCSSNAAASATALATP